MSEPNELGAPPDAVPSANAQVDGETLLYRRVAPFNYKALPDGSFRIREGVFVNPKGGRKDLSVQLGDTLAAIGKRPEDVLEGRDSTWGVAAIRAKVVTAHEQTVVRSPEPGDEAHGDVVGEKPTSRRKLFAAAACWAVLPQPGGQECG